MVSNILKNVRGSLGLTDPNNNIIKFELCAKKDVVQEGATDRNVHNDDGIQRDDDDVMQALNELRCTFYTHCLNLKLNLFNEYRTQTLFKIFVLRGLGVS